MENKYNPNKIEQKWQKFWAKNTDLISAKNDSKKPKKFILDMFPYPSGAGLHVGHVESYTATDIYSRYLRMNGYNVLHPQGFDAFGLPAENYAVKTGVHPKETTKKAIETFKRQIDSMGFSYDWSREVVSSDPEYYKWTQWLFLLFYKNGLAYKKKAKVNWCPKCQTVLANEQAEGGKCERCESEVQQKDLEQWFFKITDFIEDKEKTSGLISGLKKVDWPESTKMLQENWIGKSEGAQFKMQIKDLDEFIEVYTTRVDTVFGMTYAVLAPEHEIISKLKDKIENWSEVEKYLEDSKKKTDVDRMEAKVKTGVELQGIKIINPFNGEELPIYVADYVLSQYGTGAVMAVPSHDERDFEFAKKYNLPIRQSIALLSLGSGRDTLKEKKKTVERKASIVIVEHWEKDEILCLDWKKFNWKSFVVGGQNENETSEEAAIRETKEKTGYQDIKSIRKVGMEIHSNFYAAHKGENRYGKFNCYYMKLGSDEYVKPKEEDDENHKAVWVPKKEVESFVNLEDHLIFWNVFQNGEKAFTEDGILVNSGEYDGLTSKEAREKLIAWLEKEGIGERKINYRLRDWLVSRQRYWGAPIPIIYCEKCGEVPVSEDQLPVELSDDVDFKPTGESPLKYSKKFHDVKCPICGGKAKRESDTMDTFVCSSWYYLRYADPKNETEFASKEMLEKWLSVDLYVGGAEHSVLHLLYARFFTKVLHNLGYIKFDEPFSKLRHQGIILAEDGTKMSKSKGNVVNPDDVVSEFGADSLRMFEMFMGPLEDMKSWQTKGIVGIKRFLEKVYRLQFKIQNSKGESEIQNSKLTSLAHKTIKKVSKDIEAMRFNTAISALMILTNEMEKEKGLRVTDYELLITILSPFAPHLAEELWEKLGHKESIFKESWPKADEKYLQDSEVEMIIQVNGKLRDKITMSSDISEEEAKEKAKASEKIKNYISDKKIKKIIFVKGRLINVVI